EGYREHLQRIIKVLDLALGFAPSSFDYVLIDDRPDRLCRHWNSAQKREKTSGLENQSPSPVSKRNSRASSAVHTALRCRLRLNVDGPGVGSCRQLRSCRGAD